MLPNLFKIVVLSYLKQPTIGLVFVYYQLVPIILSWRFYYKF